MSEKKSWSHLYPEIAELFHAGKGATQIAKELIIKHQLDNDVESLRANVVKKQIAKLRDRAQYKAPVVETDKKVADFHWRKFLEPMQQMQQVLSDANGGQDYGGFKITSDQDICVLVLGDTQLGSYATDYELFKELTDFIIKTPNLYVILVGDLLQMAIKMRGVYEMMDNLLPPRFQMMFLDSWLQEVKHKVIASTWDNHSVMREEDGVGYSGYAEIFRRHTIYFNGIGHLDVQVNNFVYKFAVSHFFLGKSEMNPCHAPMKYMRYKAPDRDIAIQGDFHVPGLIEYYEGQNQRIAMVCGSIQTNSGYAKRFFNLVTQANMPVVVLSHDKKEMTPYWSIKKWLNATQK